MRIMLVWLLLVAAQVVDTLTTARAMANGATEFNPLFGLLTMPQLLWLKLAAVIAVAAVLILFPHKRKLPRVVTILSLLTFIVCLWNLIQ